MNKKYPNGPIKSKEIDAALKDFLNSLDEPAKEGAGDPLSSTVPQPQQPPSPYEEELLSGFRSVLRLGPTGDDSMFHAEALKYVSMRISRAKVYDFGNIVDEMLARTDPRVVQAMLPYLKGAYAAYCMNTDSFVDITDEELANLTDLGKVKRAEVQCNDSGHWSIRYRPEAEESSKL